MSQKSVKKSRYTTSFVGGGREISTSILVKLQGITIVLTWLFVAIFCLIFCIAAIYLNLWVKGGEDGNK
jgi:hypothetical protein